jgi:hypothetical protein
VIVRSSRFDLIGIVATFCPWCGHKLPSSLRGLYFDKVDEAGIDIDFLTPLEELPEPFRDDKWWRDDGL